MAPINFCYDLEGRETAGSFEIAIERRRDNHQLLSDAVMTVVNYYDAEEFVIRLADGEKALDMMVPEDRVIDELSDTNKAELGLAAAGQATRLMTAVLDGQDLRDMTDQEIETAVSANFSDRRDRLENAVALFEETNDAVVDHVPPSPFPFLGAKEHIQGIHPSPR